jgi:LacI family transcriptional regulator/LacI family purine nucleotide synthesis repressor
MPVTAKDIAGKLGLSQPTVSRILSGARGHRVSAETRRRVLELARELGYQPNAVARSLRHRRTNILGFYTGYGCLDARNSFLAEIIGGLQRACDSYRLDLLLHGTFRGQSTDDIYGELVDGRIDGLFVHTAPNDPLIARLADSSLPVVALADLLPRLPSVICDDADGIRQLLDYLWARGHRRIGYIAPILRLASVERRRESFQEWMRRRHLPETAAPIYRIQMEETAPALEAIRAAREPPSAVCCWNDLAAYDLLRRCAKEGVRVPDDLAVVGFDGFVDTLLPARSLVTIAAPWADVTRTAVDLLVDHIAGKEVPPETQLPVTLLTGDTA